MTHMQRILFLSKHLSVMFRYGYLNYVGQALHKQEVMKFFTLGSSNFYIINCSGVKNFEQPAKQFCALAGNKILGSKQSENTKDILSPQSLCEINLSDQDVMNTFRSLLRVYRTSRLNRSSDFEDELQKLIISNEFINFCNSLEMKLPMLSAHELKLLLNCDYFHIPSSSVLMQKIYHLIIEKINDYSPVDMVTIYVTVNSTSHKENPKSKILQLICKQYFQSKLFNNIYASKEYNKIATLCVSKAVPFSVKEKLLTVLAKNFRMIHDELTLQSLSNIFGALRFASLRSCFVPEMYHVLKNRITEKVNFLQMRNILIGLNNLMPEVISYDESFLDTLVQQALERSRGFRATIGLVDFFFKLEHLPFPLIKHLECLLAKPDFNLTSLNLGLKLASILSNAYYHPLGYSGDDSNHIESIKKLESLDFKSLDVEVFVHWCLYLTALGSQRQIECLNDLFDYLIDTYKSAGEVDLAECTVEAIITLHAFARRNFPDDVVQLPETFLRLCHAALRTEFVNSIHKGLGKLSEANAAVEYCTTSMYHFIDFAVLLNQENKPEVITTDSENNSANDALKIENIKKPPLSRLILYQIYRGQDPFQFKNCPTLPGTVQLYLQTFEPYDCRVVLFYSKKLQNLDSKHRMSYLMENINNSFM